MHRNWQQEHRHCRRWEQSEVRNSHLWTAAAGAVATKVGALAEELPDILGENNKNVTDLQTGVTELADGAKALQTGYKSTLLKGYRPAMLSGATTAYKEQQDDQEWCNTA